MRDFYKIKTIIEKVIYTILPVVIGVLSFFLIQRFYKIENFKIDDFLNDFINSQINVMALFISFSMAYLTILITSTSQNIEEIKVKTSKTYKINNKPVYLFQILLVDTTYTIVAEIILLVLSFMQKFLIVISNLTFKQIFLVIDIVLLSHIIFLVLRNVKNIYFTFWKPQ
jgi:hypothetical protein